MSHLMVRRSTSYAALAAAPAASPPPRSSSMSRGPPAANGDASAAAPAANVASSVSAVSHASVAPSSAAASAPLPAPADAPPLLAAEMAQPAAGAAAAGVAAVAANGAAGGDVLVPANIVANHPPAGGGAPLPVIVIAPPPGAGGAGPAVPAAPAQGGGGGAHDAVDVEAFHAAQNSAALNDAISARAAAMIDAEVARLRAVGSSQQNQQATTTRAQAQAQLKNVAEKQKDVRERMAAAESIVANMLAEQESLQKELDELQLQEENLRVAAGFPPLPKVPAKSAEKNSPPPPPSSSSSPNSRESKRINAKQKRVQLKNDVRKTIAELKEKHATAKIARTAERAMKAHVPLFAVRDALESIEGGVSACMFGWPQLCPHGDDCKYPHRTDFCPSRAPVVSDVSRGRGGGANRRAPRSTGANAAAVPLSPALDRQGDLRRDDTAPAAPAAAVAIPPASIVDQVVQALKPFLSNFHMSAPHHVASYTPPAFVPQIQHNVQPFFPAAPQYVNVPFGAAYCQPRSIYNC